MSLDERNAELERKLEVNPIDEQIALLIKIDARRRFQFRLLAISLLLDVFLTFGFGYVTIQTHSIAIQAEDNRTALIRNCETANESRRNNRMLWDYLLAIPRSEPPTLQQQQTRTEFKAFIDKTFALRDCKAEASSSDIINSQVSNR